MKCTSLSVISRDFAFRYLEGRNYSSILWCKKSNSRCPAFDRGCNTPDSSPVNTNGKYGHILVSCFSTLTCSIRNVKMKEKYACFCSSSYITNELVAKLLKSNFHSSPTVCALKKK